MILHPARYYAIFLALILPLRLSAQLSVVQGSTVGMTPLQFVQTYLVGQGVTVTNATFNDLPDPLNSITRPALIQDQIGSFGTTAGATTQLGLNGGVILSTGKAQNAIVGSNTSIPTGGETDPDLVILATPPSSPTPIAVHDKSVLEFDFIPETDVITFRYVFASVEFDDYCPAPGNPDFNDAFGLFLSGPGIVGNAGFLNDAVNIALLPSGNNYVNIANICSADNGNHTVNGVYSWWNLPKTYYSYNRFSYVFTATRQVTCGQTYHMKFAIGDAWDDKWDSGVFLEQNSFSSTDISLTTSFSNPQTGSFLIPDCSTSDLICHIGQVKSSDVVIDLSIDVSGTASQADILPNPFPTQVVIVAGQIQSAPITIQAVPSSSPPPDKTLVIKAFNLNCAATAPITTSLIIKYNDVLSVSVPPQTMCYGSSATLTATVTGGQPIVPSNTYSYLWSNSATTPSITVSPGPGNNPYSVAVTDACNQSITKQTSVDVGVVPLISGIITGPTDICPPESNIIYTVPSTPGADSYHWFLPLGATITNGGNTNSITVSFDNTAVSGTISVYGINLICGNGTPSTPLFVTINPKPYPAGAITGPATVCQGETGKIFSVSPIPNATSYIWTLPPGAGITSGNGTNSITVAFNNTSVSGQVSVIGHNLLCGDGTASVGYPVLVNLKPNVSFQACTPLKTIRNGRKIQLKGGLPLPGLYYANEGVSPIPGTDQFEFDPSVVTGPFPKNVFITFRYQNSLNCLDEKTRTITVFGMNADIVDPSTMKDLRDDRQYTFASFGSGASIKSWMTQNLNYGTFFPDMPAQMNNCVPEKFCPLSDNNCSGPGGGYYQWDELMEYQIGYGYQDLCPPGWHVPTESEWQTLIDNMNPIFPAPSANATAGNELKDPASSFQALMAGVNYLNRNTWTFTSGLMVSMFWTSTKEGFNKAIARGLNNNPDVSSISRYSSSLANAFSVRCMKD